MGRISDSCTPTTLNDNWLLWGDFNEIISLSERLGPSAYDDDGPEEFLHTLLSTGLSAMCPNGEHLHGQMEELEMREC